MTYVGDYMTYVSLGILYTEWVIGRLVQVGC